MTDEPLSSGRRLHHDELAVAANSGDRGAAGAYLEGSLPQLLSMARWVANGVVDPEDLVSEAITGLLSQWAQGTGPTSNPNSYVVRSMRNRVIDEYRSPRSKVRAVVDLDAEIRPHIDSTQHADLHREFGYVRAALASLQPDQQRVLRAIVIEGRKPAELEEELGRPAPAISSLVRRAKVGLRRATLRVMLEEDAPERCRRAARNLPEKVTESVEESADTPGMAHIRSCPRCRVAWGRFAAIASTLGIVPLLVGGQVLTPSDAAAADEAPGASPSSPRGGTTRGPASTTLMRIVALASIVAGVTIVILAIPGLAPAWFGGASTELRFSVTSRVVEAERAEIGVDLDLADTTDLVLDLTLPAGVEVRQVPQSWTCSVRSTDLMCRIDGTTVGTIVLDDARGNEDGGYRVTISGRRGDQAIAGQATGGITSEQQTVSAVVD